MFTFRYLRSLHEDTEYIEQCISEALEACFLNNSYLFGFQTSHCYESMLDNTTFQKCSTLTLAEMLHTQSNMSTLASSVYHQSRTHALGLVATQMLIYSGTVKLTVFNLLKNRFSSEKENNISNLGSSLCFSNGRYSLSTAKRTIIPSNKRSVLSSHDNLVPWGTSKAHDQLLMSYEQDSVMSCSSYYSICDVSLKEKEIDEKYLDSSVPALSDITNGIWSDTMPESEDLHAFLDSFELSGEINLSDFNLSSNLKNFSSVLNDQDSKEGMFPRHGNQSNAITSSSILCLRDKTTKKSFVAETDESDSGENKWSPKTTNHPTKTDVTPGYSSLETDDSIILATQGTPRMPIKFSARGSDKRDLRKHVLQRCTARNMAEKQVIKPRILYQHSEESEKSATSPENVETISLDLSECSLYDASQDLFGSCEKSMDNMSNVSKEYKTKVSKSSQLLDSGCETRTNNSAGILTPIFQSTPRIEGRSRPVQLSSGGYLFNSQQSGSICLFTDDSLSLELKSSQSLYDYDTMNSNIESIDNSADLFSD